MLRTCTLVFLVKRNGDAVTEVCLAMKKRGFGMNRWNGVGGKLQENETIEECAKREAREEIGVRIKTMKKVAELSFYFPHNPAWDNIAHTYICDAWSGEPKESEEMRPQWFAPAEIPFGEMWPDDAFWLPQVLAGTLIKAAFVFGENDTILEKDIRIVKTFENCQTG